jgi:hypothetical protein
MNSDLVYASSLLASVSPRHLLSQLCSGTCWLWTEMSTSSIAWSSIEARNPITTDGLHLATKAGTGNHSCHISKRWVSTCRSPHGRTLTMSTSERDIHAVNCGYCRLIHCHLWSEFLWMSGLYALDIRTILLAICSPSIFKECSPTLTLENLINATRELGIETLYN